MFKKSLYSALLMLAIQAPVFGDEINSQALLQTQDCLNNMNCEAINPPAGQAANQQALSVMGGNSANTQALYSISAEILPILLQQAGGNPDKMLEIMSRAQTNPEAFYNSLPADIQAKIRTAAANAPK